MSTFVQCRNLDSTLPQLDQFGACFTRAIDRAGLWGAVGFYGITNFFEFEPRPRARPLACLHKTPITPTFVVCPPPASLLFNKPPPPRGNGKRHWSRHKTKGTSHSSPPPPLNSPSSAYLSMSLSLSLSLSLYLSLPQKIAWCS